MSPSTYRNLSYSLLQGEQIEEKFLNQIKEFINYVHAYCADLKCTENDVLTDDKLFNNVFNLFDVVILQKKPQYELK